MLPKENYEKEEIYNYMRSFAIRSEHKNIKVEGVGFDLRLVLK